MSALHLQFSQVYCDVCSSVQYLQKYDLYKKLSLFILIKKKTNCNNAWTFFPSYQGRKIKKIIIKLIFTKLSPFMLKKKTL